MARRRPQPDGGDGAKRCGVYVRVSTEMQVENNSLTTQETQLKAWAEGHGWVVVKVFADAGLSAKDTKRPAFQQMIRWAKDGRIDVILVTKIDRISRNLSDLLGLIDDLKDWGVDFVAASQSFDTSTPMGMLILNILGSFAQFEREMTGERVRENMRERAKSGLWSGGRTPFGYRLDDETKRLEVNRREAKIVRAVFDEYLRTRSVRRTITTMNAAKQWNRAGKPWSRATIRRMLANPVYVGTIRYAKRSWRNGRIRKADEDKWIVVEDACDSIIRKADFEAVQAELEGNGHSRSWSETSQYLLTGLVRCGACGHVMCGATSKGGNGHPHQYYRCTGRILKGKSVCEGVNCRADELDEAVVAHVTGFDAKTLTREIKAYRRRLAKQAKPLARKRDQLQAEFDRFREREGRLLELYEEAIIDLAAYRDRRGQLERQRLAIAQEIAEIEMRLPENGLAEVDPDELAGRFNAFRETFPNLSLRDRQRLIQAVVRSITVHDDGRAEVDFHLIDGLDAADLPVSRYREVAVGGNGDTFGARLAAWREERGMTAKALAARLGVNADSLAAWERDERKPQRRCREAILAATGVRYSPNGDGDVRRGP